MSELIVCLGMWLSMCGTVVRQDFPSEKACQDVLADFRTRPNFTYGYCRVPKEKPQ